METSGKFVFKKVETPKTNAIAPIINYLTAQVDTLSKLEVVIDKEYTALKERHFDELGPISTLKSDLMLKLQGNDQKLKMHPDVELLKTQYVTEVNIIKNKMSKCKFRNEINGKLIKFCMQSSNRLQALLVGVKYVVTRNMTYTNKGNATARGLSRLSVSA
jgi:flagellar biosynthesis/type III secretory pathway chaperone